MIMENSSELNTNVYVDIFFNELDVINISVWRKLSIKNSAYLFVGKDIELETCIFKGKGLSVKT